MKELTIRKLKPKSRLIRQIVNGRAEMLPADPKETVLIFKERRAGSAAMRARRKMDAEAKKRGL